MKNSFKTCGDVTYIFYTRRNDGKTYKTAINTSDFDLVNSIPGNWHVGLFGHKRQPYFMCHLAGVPRGAKGRNLLLHRFIMGQPPKMVVDHMSGDSLDNRRSNLQAITHSANLLKAELTTKNTSKGRNATGYKNIHFGNNRYSVIVACQYWGSYGTLKDAAKQAHTVRTWLNWQRIGQHQGQPEPQKAIAKRRQRNYTKKYMTHEERMEARQRSYHKYIATPKGQAALQRARDNLKARRKAA